MPVHARAAAEEAVYPDPGGVAGGVAGVRFEPAVILPVQLLRRGPAALQPEKRLMLAVLEDAVAIFFAHRRAGKGAARQLLTEVEEWFASADVGSPFAFLRICEALGLDASYLRSGLARIRDARGDAKTPVFYPFRRIAGIRHTIGS